jgi:hypothetical protein
LGRFCLGKNRILGRVQLVRPQLTHLCRTRGIRIGAVHVQDGKTGAAYGARFLLGYALARAQQEVRAPPSA